MADKAKLPHGLIGADDPSLPAPTEGEKVSQTAVNYQVQAPNSAARCQLCQNWVEPDRCLIVSGVINPMGVSDFFTPAAQNGPISPAGELPPPEDLGIHVG